MKCSRVLEISKNSAVKHKVLCLLLTTFSQIALELVFVISATSEVADQAFNLTKKCIGYVIRKHDNQRANFQVIVHGEDSSSKKICFKSKFLDKAALLESVDELKRGTATLHAVHKDLELACEAFKSENIQPNAEKVRQ